MHTKPKFREGVSPKALTFVSGT